MSSNIIKNIFVKLKTSTEIIFISIISAFIAIVISQQILPSFVTSLERTLETMSILDITNIISWSALLMTLIATIIMILVMSAVKKTQFSQMLSIMLVSLTFTIIIVCFISFMYLGVKYDDVFTNTNILTRVLKFYSYPSLVSLMIQDPQPIWIITSFVFILNFNLLYMARSKKSKK
jgi:hypothetical protein